MIQELDNYMKIFDPIRRAGAFAADAHAGQKRKHTGEDYFVHCVDVAARLMTRGAEDDVVIAATLHDTIEDTEATVEMIEYLFGERVARLVTILTDEPPSEGRNRRTRKAATRMRYLLTQGQDAIDAHSIKCADIASNWPSIRDNDPSFAEVYKKECLDLLGVLVCADVHLKDDAVAVLGGNPRQYRSRDHFTIDFREQQEIKERRAEQLTLR